MFNRIIHYRSGLLVVIAASIIFGFVNSMVAVRQSVAAATISVQAASQVSSGGNLVVVAVEPREKTIRFGDHLEVLVTLQNRSETSMKIGPGALSLKNSSWTGFPGGGSGLGEDLLRLPAGGTEGAIALGPGESVMLSGKNFEVAAQTLGPVTAGFKIESSVPELAKQLGKSAEFKVDCSVAPSDLISSVWAAKTQAQRERLQPLIREVLLLRTDGDGWRNRLFVQGTFRFMGCHSLPYLESAIKDADPIVRQRAIGTLTMVWWNADSLNLLIGRADVKKGWPGWDQPIEKCDEKLAIAETIRLGMSALSDNDPGCRIAAIRLLTDRARRDANLRRSLAIRPPGEATKDERTRQIYSQIGLIDPALPLIQRMAGDPDAGVRGEAQKFLSIFAAEQSVAGNVAGSLGDSDGGVRRQALDALRHSPEPPPMPTLEQAYGGARGEAAVGLIELMYEREDSALAGRLLPGFKERSAPERLMVMTAIAGHTDAAAINLIDLGLRDTDSAIQRAALMRLLALPSDRAASLMSADSAGLLPELRLLGATVQEELKSRRLFPLLGRWTDQAVENAFPSQEGTEPMVSPDGRWVAYVETGWGRPGGSGGTGRSNLLSLVHIVGSDGSGDHLVSDMFFIGWMADSQRLASSRDGFAAVVDLNGGIVSEFGEPLDKPDEGRRFGREKWPGGETRSQMGVAMPHSKRFSNPDLRAGNFDYGEDAAVSPDGKWFGPRVVNDQLEFVDGAGHKVTIKISDRRTYWGWRAVWSPDGAHIIIVPLQPGNSFGRGEAIEQRSAPIIDFGARSTTSVLELDQFPNIGGWDYRKARWNPWSKDGRHLAFVRHGQVWVADADGANARQLTFDASNKAFPTFSPDGSKIAYVTWQFDNREQYTRMGPTDLWVVDCATGLAARLSGPDPRHIEGLDWLDNNTVIFDRLDSGERHSALKTVSLR